MTTNVFQYAPPAFPDAKIVRMSGAADCQINAEEFVALLQAKGAAEAEEVVFSALENMAAKIEHLRLLWEDGHFDDMPKLARRLGKVAKGAGLTSVDLACSAVVGAVQSADVVATAATINRVDRSFDAAVEQIWQVFDQI